MKKAKGGVGGSTPPRFEEEHSTRERSKRSNTLREIRERERVSQGKAHGKKTVSAGGAHGVRREKG